MSKKSVESQHRSDQEVYPVTSSHLMDSKTNQLDDALKTKLEEALTHSDYQTQCHNIAKIASEHNPIDLAYAAVKLPNQARFVLFENLIDIEAKVTFLITVESNTRTCIFRELDDQEIIELIERMPLDEVVWVLDDVTERRFRRLLTSIDLKKAHYIKELRQRDKNSAARLMTSEFFAFTMDITIAEAAKCIRDHPNIEITRRIFVLNEKRQLQGFVPARNLIVNSRDIPLKQVMRPVSHKVSPDANREEVIDIVERYKISALPVLDEDHILVGVITYEDVVEALEDITDETIARMVGTTESVGVNEPVIKRLFLRAPWLMVTLIAGLINAMGMAYFESKEGTVLAFVLFFVPLITGMSGNIGIQCSTILVRSMATGALTAGSVGEAIKKEMVIGTLAGLIFGILAGATVYFLDIFGCPLVCASPVIVGSIVSIGLFGACLCGTLLGIFSPLFFARLGVDPAVASGPIITAFNDFLSMMIYFIIAWALSFLFFL